MKASRLTFLFLVASALSSLAQTALDITVLANQTVRLAWPANAAGAKLESSAALGGAANWQPVPAAPTLVNGRNTLLVIAGTDARFFRLRLAAATFTTVRETSPASGESGVAVTRETIFRLTAPLAANTVIGPNTLFAGFGGRRLLSRAELSSDRRTLTLFYLENLPGSARINVVLDAAGLSDENGQPFDADGDGQPGGVRVFEFNTAGITGLANTAVIGKVFASEKNADGSNRPLENVTITVDGAEETLRTTTDATGSFTLSPAPAGRSFVHVDGRTAIGSQWPGGAYYPFVGKAWETVAGKTNNLAGGSGEIFLPLIQSDALRSVSATEETKVTFAPSVLAANPALAGAEVNVPANSLFSDNGARGGKVGIAPVPPDRLPEPLPSGLNFPLVITVQTDGGANFDRPVPVKFPNLPDPKTGVKLPPGAKTALWSFNHDTGRWEAQGTMTISADGQFAVSDAGVGIRQPGWHGTSPGGSGGGPGGGPPPPGCPPYCGPRPDPPCNEPDPCGHLHYLYREALEKWQREAELKESFTTASVVALGREVDKAYDAYSDCRTANGRPCQGGNTQAYAPDSSSIRSLAKASLPDEASARFDVAIQNTIDEQNAARSNTPLPGAGAWFVLEALETGFLQRGRLNSEGSVENLILAPNERYRMSYYDAVNRRGGAAYFRSQAAGQRTYIPYAILYGSEFGAPLDADADGLSNFAERVLGTSSTKADSDGDGIKDGQELSLGTNPLDGVGLPTGVVSTAPTPGIAYDVAVENDLALLACTGGLAVFDVSNPQAPLQIAVVPGASSAVVLRGRLALVTQAGSNAGLLMVDLTTPASPRTLWSRPDLSSASAVAFGNQSMFACSGTQLYRLDPATGADRGVLQIGNCDSLISHGDLVYALTDDKLTVCRDGDLLELVGTVPAPGSGGAGGRPRQLFLASDLLYAQHNFGFNAFDLIDPAIPVLVKDFKSGQAGWRDLALTGTGLALTADGRNSTSDGPHDVSLYRLQAGGTDAQFITTFVTPGEAYAVAIAGARGYVADGTAGLTVVNFLDADLAGVPPTVSVSVDSPATPPQVEGGSLARISATASDDVAVRYVEFLINGVVVARDESYPYELLQRVPPVSPVNSSIKVRARAVDTAGNVSESAELTVRIVLDATPPAVVSFDPAPGTTIPNVVITDVSVVFNEPMVTPVGTTTLTLRTTGADGKFDTADDVVIPGDVQWLAAEKTIHFRSAATFVTGRYRATLAAGLSDAAGNVRSRATVWEFVTGAPARVETLFPPSNFVRVGGILDELKFTFNQPVPKIIADTYVWKVTRRPYPTDDSGTFGSLETITPLQVQRSADGRTFTLRTPSNFPSGQYVVTGSGPNVQGMRWEFYFRDFPNEARNTAIASGIGLITNWKWFPGPGVGDELIVNLPGVLAPVVTSGIKSLVAYSDILFNNQEINVPTPIQSLAGLELRGTRFGPGVTDVYGPLAIVSISDLGSHVLNARGGGYLRQSVQFFDPNGAFVNHPGSTFVLSNTASIVNLVNDVTNAGRLVNLGTLRALGAAGSLTPNVRIEDVRTRNDGRIEVASGGLKINSIDNEGVMEIAAGAKLFLHERVRGGVSSRITGDGDVEFGEYIPGRRPVVSAADAEIRGDFDSRGNVTLAAGNLTLWRPFVHPAGVVKLQNQSTLHLLGPAQIGTLAALGAFLESSGETEIGTLDSISSVRFRAAVVFRVKGDARLSGFFEATGPGLVEFLGTTTLAPGGSGTGVQFGNATVRNRGTWRYGGGGIEGSDIRLQRVNGQPGTGFFENAGLLENAGGAPLTIYAPFRNAGRMVCDQGPVVIDARQTGGAANFGAYLPQPGCELVLNGTAFRQAYGGELDLTAGTLRGTGSIEPGVAAGDVLRKVTNRGIIRVGNPTGEIFIRAQNFEQTATGEIIVTLSAAGAGRLRLREGATLAGTLTVELADGFDPPLGQFYNVINYSGHAGEFTTFKLPDLGAGKKLVVKHFDSAVTVQVVSQ